MIVCIFILMPRPSDLFRAALVQDSALAGSTETTARCHAALSRTAGLAGKINKNRWIAPGRLIVASASAVVFQAQRI